MEKADDSTTYAKGTRTLVTAGVVIGMFLSAIDTTAVTTAMPTIVSSLGGLELYSWVFAAYTLTATITLPLWGRLSDFYGRRGFYVLGTGIFLLGSILSGTSGTMNELIAYRALQGIGAGALITLGTTIIGEIYSLRERAKIQGLFGGAWGLSSILGPVIGGFVTDQLSWRWVFYLNLPFGIAAAIIIAYALHRSTGRPGRVSIDYSGIVVFIVMTLTLIFGMVHIATPGFHKDPMTYVLLTLISALFYVFVRVERRADQPIIPLDLFSNSYFRTSSAVSLLIGMAMFGCVSFIPLFIQGVIGTSATGTGKIITPLLLSWVALSSISGRLMLNFGYKRLIVTGAVLLTVGFLLLSMMDTSTTQKQIYGFMVLIGMGMGMIYMPTLLAVQAVVPRGTLGIATSSIQFFRSIGGVLGVTLLGTAMNYYIATGALDPTLGMTGLSSALVANPDLVVNPVTRAQLSPASLEALRGLLAYALRGVFQVGLLFAFLAFIAALFVPRGNGFRDE